MRTRQTCALLSGSEATIFSILLVRAPVASFLELSQMFQTEISFPLGVDILIFLPWSPGKGNARGGFHPPSRPSRERMKLVNRSHPLHLPDLAPVLSCPPSCQWSPGALVQRPSTRSLCGLALWASGWEREQGQMGRAEPGVMGWWYSSLFLFTKICSVFYSALGQREVNSLHLCCKMRIVQEMK